ncbi:MAG TPA: mechanosensitive ion channel domain-containing protein [Candidatus Peribacteraceae bacterium]|nr:mechanosensitive ion channel domain-containing protein [Candidatus Peribacteraceae bacterium]
MKRFIITALLVTLLGAPFASAQTPSVADPRLDALTQLYVQLERSPDSEYVQRRIEDELEALREEFGAEIDAVISPVTDGAQAEDLTQAIERQRRVVDVLEDQLQEHRVDVDLLDTEEEYYYSDQQTGTGSVPFRLTTTHSELKARRAMLEEELKVLEERLALAKERAQKLTIQVRFQQFALLLPIGKYALILAIIWLLERLIRTRFLVRIPDHRRRFNAVKVFSTTVYVLTALWLVTTLLSRQPNAITSFAILGAGVAIALQDIFKDLFGYFMIKRSRLFNHGHRITIGNLAPVTGEVVDIGMFRTKLLEVGDKGDVLERTGKIVSIPNAQVLTQNVVDHHATSDYLRAEMHIIMTFESDWQTAEKILMEILVEETGEDTERDRRQHEARTRLYYIPHHSRGPAIHMEIGEKGIDFTLRFSVPIGERRPVITRLTKRILEAFAKKPDIQLVKKD